MALMLVSFINLRSTQIWCFRLSLLLVSSVDTERFMYVIIYSLNQFPLHFVEFSFHRYPDFSNFFAIFQFFFFFLIFRVSTQVFYAQIVNAHKNKWMETHL